MGTDTDTPTILSISLFSVDDWLNNKLPSVDDAVMQLEHVRDLVRELRLAEAHLVGYVRELLNIDEFADDPGIVDPNSASVDV